MTGRQMRMMREKAVERRRKYKWKGTPGHGGRPKSYRLPEDCTAIIEANRRGRTATASLSEMIRSYPVEKQVEGFE